MVVGRKSDLLTVLFYQIIESEQFSNLFNVLFFRVKSSELDDCVERILLPLTSFTLYLSFQGKALSHKQYLSNYCDITIFF